MHLFSLIVCTEKQYSSALNWNENDHFLKTKSCWIALSRSDSYRQSDKVRIQWAVQLLEKINIFSLYFKHKEMRFSGDSLRNREFSHFFSKTRQNQAITNLQFSQSQLENRNRWSWNKRIYSEAFPNKTMTSEVKKCPLPSCQTWKKRAATWNERSSAANWLIALMFLLLLVHCLLWNAHYIHTYVSLKVNSK